MADIEDTLKRALAQSESIRVCQTDVEATLVNVDDAYESARQKIVEHFNVLALALDDRKNEMLTQLAQLKEYKASQLSKQLEKLKSLRDEIHEGIMRTSEADDEGDQADAQLFAQKVQDMIQHAGPLEPVETARFQYTLNRADDVAAVKKFGFLDFEPRITGIAFLYKSDFDTNGILYWIGCNYGTEQYRNPADLGLVKVTASSCEFGNVNHAVVHHTHGRKGETFMTESQPDSWLAIFLGIQYIVCPTAYTLKNCVINPCHGLANWDFQGSADGHTWVTLKSHVDDKMLLPARGSIYTWQIEGCKQFFNRFRILMTGPNQHIQPHAKFHYLMLAGMELYGYVEKAPGMN